MSETRTPYQLNTRPEQESKLDALYEACQAIIDDANFDDAWHSGSVIVKAELIERMAAVLHSITKEQQ